MNAQSGHKNNVASTTARQGQEEPSTTPAPSENHNDDIDVVMEIVAARASRSNEPHVDNVQKVSEEEKAAAGKHHQKKTPAVIKVDDSGPTGTAKEKLSSASSSKERDLSLMEIVASRACHATIEVADLTGDHDTTQSPSEEEVLLVQDPTTEHEAAPAWSDVEASQPGAYHVMALPTAAGDNLASDNSEEEDRLESDDNEEEIQPPPMAEGDIESHSGLSEAFAIDDGLELPEAEEIDPDETQAAQATQEKKRKEFIARLCAFGVLAIMMLALVLLLVFVIIPSSKHDDESTTTSSKVSENIDGTPAPNNLTTYQPELPPLDNLKHLYDNLPATTKESLANTNTPQRKAWEWLLSHGNITNLEEWRKTQIFAMATFYYAFDGHNWPEPVRKNWLDDTKEECSWTDHFAAEDAALVTYQNLRVESDENLCNDAGEIRAIHLSQFYNEKMSFKALQNPFIPPEIGLLTSLRRVGFHSCGIKASFSDVLPLELAQLPKVEAINFFDNAMTGTMPTRIGMMTDLTHITIGVNEFTGSLPKEIAALTRLQSLVMGRNRFSGSVPSYLGLMTSLTDLVLRDNSLTGRIPSQLGLLSDMFRFNLMSNSLSGWIPSELGMMVNTKWLFLQNNQLSGSIPSELWKLSQLKIVDISNLPLAGSVPNELCYLQNDETCSLAYVQDEKFEVLLPCKLAFDCTEMMCGCDCGCLLDTAGQEMAPTNASLGNNIH